MPTAGKKSLPVNAETHKKIAKERAETGKEMYLLVEEAWALYETRGKSIPISDESPVIKNRSDESTLTDDERDILAMLREKPDKDFLFSSIQTTVSHALEQYRRKWKSQAKTTHQGQAGKSQRRPTGT